MTAAPKGTLLRVLGVGFGVAVSLGNSIGAGIMRTPAEIAERLPSASLIMLAWIVGALYTLVGAWSLSEVAAMIPSAGGSYAIARRAFGNYIGFTVGWITWVALCAANAVIALVAGEYLNNLVPQFSGHTAFMATAMVVLVTIAPPTSSRDSRHFYWHTTLHRVDTRASGGHLYVRRLERSVLLWRRNHESGSRTPALDDQWGLAS